MFLPLVYPEDRPKLIAMIREASEKLTGIELEFRMQHPERGLQWVLMRGSYISPYDRVNASIMGSLIDITERKNFEQQKDEFIGIASHELRTPVTSIKAYAEVLHEIFSEAGNAESAALMGKLDAQVDRLTELIHSLLDTTRVTEGQLQLQKESFNLVALINETVEVMQRTTNSHRLELVHDCEEINVSADRERMRQVLINLISNAIKYSPAADQVIIKSSMDGTDATVCVQDFGVGIAEAVQPKIFERFFRVGEPDIATFPGLGLGLFISEEIVRKHGGTIWVNSRKGEGASFYFKIPVVLQKSPA